MLCAGAPTLYVARAARGFVPPRLVPVMICYPKAWSEPLITLIGMCAAASQPRRSVQRDKCHTPPDAPLGLQHAEWAWHSTGSDRQCFSILFRLPPPPLASTYPLGPASPRPRLRFGANACRPLYRSVRAV